MASKANNSLLSMPANAHAPANNRPCEIVCVKWNDPTDELVGIARLVHQLVANRSVDPGRVRLVAPTAAWGVQLERACESVGLAAAFCMPHAHLSRAGQESLARLRACAHGHSGQTNANLQSGSSGQAHTNKQGANGVGLANTAESGNAAGFAKHGKFAQNYAETTGFTLVRACGLATNWEFHCAVRHVRGDESACELLALVEEQLARPTLPSETNAVRIDLFQQDASAADFVFLVGCVDGLLPETAAGNTATTADGAHMATASAGAHLATAAGAANAEATAKETALVRLQAHVSSANVRATVSWFTHMEADVATRAHVKFSRIKQEEGKSVALCRPSPLLRQWGAARHGTVGGQALLRQNGLN